MMVADARQSIDSLGTTNFKKSFLKESEDLEMTSQAKLEQMRRTYEQMT